MIYFSIKISKTVRKNFAIKTRAEFWRGVLGSTPMNGTRMRGESSEGQLLTDDI